MKFATQDWALIQLRSLTYVIAAVLASGVCVSRLVAQSTPSISAGGVVNAASFMPGDRPAGAIARGSVFSIFGTDLGPLEGLANRQLPLAKELGGVAVAVFDSDGERYDVYPLFVSAGQINALMPSEVPAGQYFVRVEFAGGQSNGIAVKVVHASFGLFGRPLTISNTEPPFPTGPRVVVAQNFVDANTLDLNAPETAARPGQAVVFWGTGLGPITAPDSEAPPVMDVDTAVEVLVGGKSAEILYQGRSPCCPGVDQINLIIPPDGPLGCAVPVSVRVHGAIYSNIETISIGRDGRGCSDSATIPGGRRGRINLRRTVSGGAAIDQALATFSQSGELVAYPPAPGTCIRSQITGGLFLGLDAGPEVRLKGPLVDVSLTEGPPVYASMAPPGLLFLGPGHYTASAAGGSGDNAIGPFSAELDVGEPFNWIGPEDGAPASRDGYSLRWNGAATDANLTVSVGIAASGTSVVSICSVAAGSYELRVPAAILSNYPSQELGIQLTERWAPPGSQFTAAGLDGGVLEYLHTEVHSVVLPPAELPSTPVDLPNGRSIQAELATTFEDRASGLMNRPALADDRGMLFHFDSPGIYAFWMYRTLVPLDIIWLDSDRKIVTISPETPPCESTNSSQCVNYFPSAVSQFVLEIAAGQAAANGLGVGSQLSW